MEPLLLPVKPGSISAADKGKLSKAGIVVIEHEHPETLRLIRASLPDVDACDMLKCALKALSSSDGMSAKDQRAMFTTLLSAVLSGDAR